MTYIKDLGYEDQFGKFIGDNTQNKADIAAHFDYNVERWRYFRRNASTGGLTREFVQYGETTGFTDNVDSFTIDPIGTSQIAQMETAERFRYNVGYTQEVSFAFETNQSLGTGDKVVVGMGNPDLENNMASADGWFLEFLPSLADNEAYFNEYRNGTIVSNGGTNTLIQFEKSVTDWRRMDIEFNWYGVGSAKLTETYVDANGFQRNDVVEEVGNPTGRGPETANKKIRFGIRGGGNGTTLDVGSIGVLTNGDIDEILREKSDRFEETLNTADTWVPAYAFRSEQPVISMALRDLSVIRWTAQSDEIEVIVKGFDETKVTFGGTDSWGSPNALTPTNSSLQKRTDVDQIADQTGTLVANTTTPGGYELFRTELSPTGSQFKEGTSRASGIKIRRKLYNQDYGVILLKSPVTGETATVNYGVTEGW